jgi:regulator of cell morphogenesis and NO signaling
MPFMETDTVGQIVRNNPAAVGLFETLGIDFCCGGQRSLAEACERVNKPVDQVIADLEASLQLPPIEEDCHWLTCSLTELADHIVSRHHEYVRRELPVLRSLAARVASKHGVARPEVIELGTLLEAVDSELSPHLLKEEAVLFPAFRQMELAGEGATRRACFPALINPIRHMMEDHDDAGELLRRIRTITNQYALPTNACMTYQALYRGLKEFEEDLHRHIHLENNILFPRALEFEKSHREKVA